MNYKNFKKIFMCIFPLCDLRRASKVLIQKQRMIEEEHYHEFLSNFSDLSIGQLEEIQKDFFAYKQSFEDKAKISTIGLTITVSVIFAWAAFVGQFYNSHEVYPLATFVIVILSVYSLFNMLVAGFLSLRMMGVMNVFYNIPPSGITLEENEKKKEIAQCIEQNYVSNLMRNNCLYTSFKSLLISIISLVVVFIIIIFPFHQKKEVDDIKTLRGDLLSIGTNLQTISENLSLINESLSSIGDIEKTAFNSDKDRINKRISDFEMRVEKLLKNAIEHHKAEETDGCGLQD